MNIQHINKVKYLITIILLLISYTLYSQSGLGNTPTEIHKYILENKPTFKFDYNTTEDGYVYNYTGKLVDGYLYVYSYGFNKTHECIFYLITTENVLYNKFFKYLNDNKEYIGNNLWKGDDNSVWELEVKDNIMMLSNYYKNINKK